MIQDIGPPDGNDETGDGAAAVNTNPRAASIIATALSWTTDAVYRDDMRTVAISGSIYEPFVGGLQSFEKHVLVFSNDDTGLRWRRLFGLSRDSGIVPGTTFGGSPKDWSDLLTLMSGIKLVDVIAAIQGIATGQGQKAPRPLIADTHNLPHYGHLNDWPKLLLDFRRLHSSRPPRPVSKSKANWHITIAKSIVHNHNTTVVGKIFENICTAAMHVSYLLGTDFEEGQLPEMTGRLEKMFEVKITKDDTEANELESTKLNDFEGTYWRKFYETQEEAEAKKSSEKAKTRRERNPLFVSLLITPIFMYAPVRLTTRTFGGEAVINRCLSIGGGKPPSIDAVELVSWKVLFMLVRREIYPEEVLDVLIRELPWNMIEQASHDDAKWFVLDNLQPHAKPTQHTRSVGTPNPADASVVHVGVSGTNLVPPLAPIYDSEHLQQAILNFVAQHIVSNGNSGYGANVANPYHASGGEIVPYSTAFDMSGVTESDAQVLTDRDTEMAMAELAAIASDGNWALSTLLVEEAASNGAVMHVNPSMLMLAPNRAHNGEIEADANRRGHIQESQPGRVREEKDSEVIAQEIEDNEKEDEGHDTRPVDAIVGCDSGSELGPDVLTPSSTNQQLASNDGTSEHFIERETTAPLFLDSVMSRSASPTAIFNVEDPEMDHSLDEQPQMFSEEQNDLELERPPKRKRLRRGDAIYTESEEDDSAESERTHYETASSAIGPQGLANVMNNAHEHQEPYSSRSSSLECSNVVAASLQVETELPRASRRRSKNTARTKSKRSPPKRTTSSVLSDVEDSSEDEQPIRKKRKTARSKVRTVDHYITEMGNTAMDEAEIEKYTLFSTHFKSEPVDDPPFFSREIAASTERYTTEHPIRVWDPTGEIRYLYPKFHFTNELVNYLHVIDSVEENLVDGRPKFLSQPDKAAYKVMPHDEYRNLTRNDIKILLQRHVLVIYDMPWEETGFEDDIGNIVSSDALIEVQDNSLEHTGSGTSRLVRSTRTDIMNDIRNGGDCKALNALALPMEVPHQEDDKIASCMTAWRNTKKLLFDSPNSLPSTDMNWALMATGGAITHWHLDCEGFATIVDVITGSKIWTIASDPVERLDRIGALLSPNFVLDSAPRNMRTESILLKARTRLIMGPNRLHMVYTTEPTTCRGSHFYSTHTMQSTLSSMVHGFVCHSYITNTSHPDTRVFIRRMMHFCHRGLVDKVAMTSNESSHIPKLDVDVGGSVSMDEVLNLLSICALSFLSNALDPRSYLAVNQKGEEAMSEEQEAVIKILGVNAIPRAERSDICRARGVAIDTIEWLRDHIKVELEGEEVDLPSVFFVAIGVSILRYKFVAETNSITSSSRCTMEQLRYELDACYELDAKSRHLWAISTADNRWIDNELKCEDNILLPDIDDTGHDEYTQLTPSKSGEDTVVQKAVNMFTGHIYTDDEPGKWRNDVIGLSKKHLYNATRVHENKGERIHSSEWIARGTRGLDDAYFCTIKSRDAMTAVQDRGFVEGLLEILRDKKAKELE